MRLDEKGFKEGGKLGRVEFCCHSGKDDFMTENNKKFAGYTNEDYIDYICMKLRTCNDSRLIRKVFVFVKSIMD